jgi:hypothetical protein
MPALGLRPAVLTILLLVALTGCGTDAGSTSDAEDRAYISEEEGIEVPDVSLEDGADAVSSIESEGLTATLVDANGEFGFDGHPDASGCEVVDQTPAGGELVAEGDDVEVTVDCAQVDWENQEGAGWDAFNDGYGDGFDEGCQELFDESPDGSFTRTTTSTRSSTARTSTPATAAPPPTCPRMCRTIPRPPAWSWDSSTGAGRSSSSRVSGR